MSPEGKAARVPNSPAAHDQGNPSKAPWLPMQAAWESGLIDENTQSDWRMIV
jgi:hypothetical protein